MWHQFSLHALTYCRLCKDASGPGRVRLWSRSLDYVMAVPAEPRVPPSRSVLIIRSYQGESTGSHPNSEVKHPWACSVLRGGTTRESQVTNVFPDFGPGRAAHNAYRASRCIRAPRSGLQSYLLGLLAKIKCSICSYQLNLWYVAHGVT